MPDPTDQPRRVAIAIAAHPDDIEFMMAGTLLLLRNAGWVIHYLNVSSGNCGSNSLSASGTEAERLAEAQEAADFLGATFHPPFSRDLEIFYDLQHLRHLTSIIREVNPTIVLTHSPEDYMEDHTNTSRLAVTAAFSRGMPNFEVSPARPPVGGEVAVYHGMPHGLRDAMRRRVVPGLFIDTASVLETKRQALAAHRSQKEWLDVSQGLNSYLQTMEEMSLALGRMSGEFQHAEGWRRHSHLGFSAVEIDPLGQALGQAALANSDYENGLG
ncbi:MAG: PIG-L family deacetylase [Pedosphaera sp.]|nr:PIG-L family deacetylase [Pedosphaera sp.]